MGYRRSRGWGVLRVLFLRGKLSGFDASIRLAGNSDGERRVLQSIADGIEDHGIGDDFVPVGYGKLGCKCDRLVDRSLFNDFTQILGFCRRKFRIPISSMMIKSNLASLSR